MNYAKIETSTRLQTLLKVLQQGGWWSTRELMLQTYSCNVSTDICELRHNGFEIDRRISKSETGAIHTYRLVRLEVSAASNVTAKEIQGSLF